MLIQTFKQDSGSCLKLQKLFQKFRLKFIKNENHISYLAKKEEKAIFPVVFRSGACFGLPRPFFEFFLKLFSWAGCYTNGKLSKNL